MIQELYNDLYSDFHIPNSDDSYPLIYSLLPIIPNNLFGFHKPYGSLQERPKEQQRLNDSELQPIIMATTNNMDTDISTWSNLGEFLQKSPQKRPHVIDSKF